MNKDETIEQMAKDLVDEIEFDITFYDFNGSAGIRFDYVGTAKNVVEKGYRKVADDEVVLKQSEVDEFRKDHAEVKFLKDKIKQETAREILQEMFGYMGSHQKFCIVDYEHKTLIDLDGLWAKGAELAKKFGIELE